MNILKIIFGLFVTSIVAACGGSDGPVEVPFTLIRADWQSTNAIANYVFTDEQDLKMRWGKFVYVPKQPDGSYQVVYPTVDYTQQMVVGLVRGTDTSGCGGGLTITQVLNDGEHIQVHAFLSVMSNTSSSSCPGALVPNTAFAIIPRSDLPVTFVQTSD